MLIIEQLVNKYNFTNSEKSISDYILSNTDLFFELSAEEVAKLTFTSKSTVVRMCKKIDTNIKNYQDFKLKLKSEITEKNSLIDIKKLNPVSLDCGYDEISNMIPQLYTAVSLNTRSHIDKTALSRVINKIVSAKQIDFYGLGASFYIAQEAAFRYQSLGYECNAYTVINEDYLNSKGKLSSTVAVLICLRNENEVLAKFAKMLKNSGAYVLGIVVEDNYDIDTICHHILKIYYKDINSNLENTMKSSGVRYLIDTIYALTYAKKMKQTSQKNKL